MTTVFISGSISITNLDPLVIERIKKIVDLGYRILVGDADGVDSSIQNYLLQFDSKSTTIFCSGEYPRNNLGLWDVRSVTTNHKIGTREFFTAKDIKMAEEADYGLMIWDTKSTGTLNNVIELLKLNKKSAVFINKNKEFMAIKTPEHLEALIGYMSPAAITKADKKINIHKKISELKNQIPLNLKP
ncbi:hypothetical protein [Neisseria dentiae]|uniref:hypothetical protein n=1 Tax=Neisseria dentiae TaxID=194197 RepID=UPI0035A1549B